MEGLHFRMVVGYSTGRPTRQSKDNVMIGHLKKPVEE
jgi:hypothetical protein